MFTVSQTDSLGDDNILQWVVVLVTLLASILVSLLASLLRVAKVDNFDLRLWSNHTEMEKITSAQLVRGNELVQTAPPKESLLLFFLDKYIIKSSMNIKVDHVAD